MTKQELRTLFLNKRNSLSAREVDELSAKIAENFLSAFDTKGKTVHVYLPIASKNEPDTRLIISKIKADSRIVVSRSNFNTAEMTHLEWNSATSFIVNSYGIEEPTGGKVVDSAAIDMVLVPLLAYDLKGNRAGYGKGFYDRFLKNCKSKTKRIGLSFFDPIDEVGEIGKYDVKLSSCVTPNQVHHF